MIQNRKQQHLCTAGSRQRTMRRSRQMSGSLMNGEIKTIAEQIYMLIRSDILHHKLTCGERLTMKFLQERLARMRFFCVRKRRPPIWITAWPSPTDAPARWIPCRSP